MRENKLIDVLYKNYYIIFLTFQQSLFYVLNSENVNYPMFLNPDIACFNRKTTGLYSLLHQNTV